MRHVVVSRHDLGNQLLSGIAGDDFAPTDMVDICFDADTQGCLVNLRSASLGCCVAWFQRPIGRQSDNTTRPRTVSWKPYKLNKRSLPSLMLTTVRV